ncbi:Zinc finger CCHC domain-containing protein [Actinidia chinensis var. chinensis]|uniref:Zinc finger CCHC domain-containing protein n=1 Tax=Actinidia chinensis var. chinensis TaxID=1590841 RepID=A0A2R6Q0L2_ACTCC|nr:Zinc finger CCHC domain-containing protein [Actinidia chinensis var. chinensis]
MQTDDLIDPHASVCSDCESEHGKLHNYNCELDDPDSQPSNLEVKKDEINEEISGTDEIDVGNRDGQLLLAVEMNRDLTGCSSVLQVSVEVSDTVAVAEDVNCSNSRIETENGCLTVQDGSPIRSLKRDGSPVSNSISSVKKARITVGEQQPSVHVMYNSLTRDSKRKLVELLQHWSEWHAKHCSLSHDLTEVVESGEETYFPALRVGLDNPSAVSFWMDNQPSNQQSKEFIALDNNSVPVYDRGYSMVLTSTDGSSNLEGGLEIVNASRCFNCGSYNHSLKECPKPRDNAAVNNARKQHKSRRNQNASSRNPTRYYQDSPGGKYDGLRPGVLDAETRQLLGLGELDPPPWLNRMREIGYPPGYLDPDDEDQPSGITIFGDEEIKVETEDGEILDANYLEPPEPPKKMSVEFPGINAPIPENADERRWTTGPSSSDSSRNRSHWKFNQSEPKSRGQYHEQRWSSDFRDEWPSGSAHNLSSYSQRNDFYDDSYSFQSARSNISRPRSPSLGRSFSDRDRRSPLVHEGSSNSGSYNSVPYSPSNRLFSPTNYGSASSERWDGNSSINFDPNFSSRHKDKHDERHHRRRR